MFQPPRRPLSFIGFRPTGDLGPLTCYTSKRRKPVWFLKSPPTKPPTHHQIAQRNKFRFVAMAWKGLTNAEREQWRLAERRGALSITAYNLFTYWSLTRRDDLIRTLERQTGTKLIT